MMTARRGSEPRRCGRARDGRSLVVPLDIELPLRNNIRIGAQLKHFDPSACIDAAVLPLPDRFTVGRRGRGRPRPNRSPRPATVGTIVGTSAERRRSRPGIHNAYVTQQAIDPRKRSAAWGRTRLLSQLSARYGARGPSFAVSSACASGAQAIGIGTRHDLLRVVERALVGGTEACMTGSGI